MRAWVYQMAVTGAGWREGELVLHARTIGKARSMARQETQASVKSVTIWHLLKGGGREMVARYEKGEEV